jgi:CubicO group peptidase (beta-lactamase class C family)
MTQNQIGSLAYPWGEGIKFGYGFYVVTDSQKSDLSDSNGSFGWSGVADTHFSIDPEKNMILILMTQRAWPYSGVWKVFNDMTYRALNKENS